MSIASKVNTIYIADMDKNITSMDIRDPGLRALPPGVERHLVKGGGLSVINLDPDEDFLIMCNAKYFVPSGGGFSDVITNIVKLKGGRVISSSSPTQMLPRSTLLNQRRLLSSKPKLSPGTSTMGKSFITNNKEKKNDINQSDSYKFVDFWIHK